ncbi:hypothetical protein F4604DRAFT_762718 [Suillus subluteus]|nr:hypothetical protein F4604DRAFT_762718 [Suillus subluteus]
MCQSSLVTLTPSWLLRSIALGSVLLWPASIGPCSFAQYHCMSVDNPEIFLMLCDNGRPQGCHGGQSDYINLEGYTHRLRKSIAPSRLGRPTYFLALSKHRVPDKASSRISGQDV